MREDAPVVRYLFKTCGPESAMEWQRKPYVVFPEHEFRNRFDLSGGDTILFHDEKTAMPSLRLPWSDFVLHLGSWFEYFIMTTDHHVRERDSGSPPPTQGLLKAFDPFLGNMWAKVSEFAPIARRGGDSPSMIDRYAAQSLPAIQTHELLPDDVVLFALYSENALKTPDYRISAGPMSVPYFPLLYLVRKNNPWSHKKRFFGSLLSNEIMPLGIEALGNAMHLCIDVTLSAIAHILHGDEHPVEVRPANPSKTRNTTKPWTREDLPRILLIDPSCVREYRSQSGAAKETHASPRPHRRRGHYRTLRSDRFGDNKGKRVFVKPAWIGDTQWEHEGQIYKVLPVPRPAMREEISA